MDIVELLSRVALLGSAWVLWLLLGLSVVSFAAMFERVLFFRRNTSAGQSLRTGLAVAFDKGDDGSVSRALEQSPSVEARVLQKAFAWRAGGPEALADALESELGRERPALERGTTLLGTIGNNAPFIGLFGTVIGVIAAFHHLGVGTASDAAMGNVMAGISEALVATGVGLFVALPAVVAYNLVQKRIDHVENETRALGRLLGAWLRSRPVTGERPRSSAVVE